MATTSEIISLLDNGIDPAFAVSVAGLSLAAAAFFSSTADTIIKDSQLAIEKIDPLIERAEQQGYTKTANHKKKIALEKSIQQASDVQKSLIKAFLISVWFVIYTITLDQVIADDTAVKFVQYFASSDNPDTQGYGFISRVTDLGISAIMLSLAGKNLWFGAKGIGSYFDVNFSEEIESAKKILSATAVAMTGSKGEVSNEYGSIELSLVIPEGHNKPFSLEVRLDGELQDKITGGSWAASNIKAGDHTLRLIDQENGIDLHKVISVAPETTNQVEIEL